jgi:hypothetical protein
VHMCPHLHPIWTDVLIKEKQQQNKISKSRKGKTHSKALLSWPRKTSEEKRQWYLYNRESIWLSQQTQHVPFLTWPHLDPSSDVSAPNPATWDIFQVNNQR